MIIESSASTVVNICRSVFESCIEGSHTAYTVDLSWIHKKCKRPRTVTFLGRGATGWNIWVCSGCHQGSTWNHNSLGLCGGMINVAYISSWFPLFQTIAIPFSCFRISSENDLLYLSLIPVLIHYDIFLKWKDKICSAHNIPDRNSMLTFQEMDQTLKVTVHNAVIPLRGNVLSLAIKVMYVEVKFCSLTATGCCFHSQSIYFCWGILFQNRYFPVSDLSSPRCSGLRINKLHLGALKMGIWCVPSLQWRRSPSGQRATCVNICCPAPQTHEHEFACTWNRKSINQDRRVKIP